MGLFYIRYSVPSGLQCAFRSMVAFRALSRLQRYCKLNGLLQPCLWQQRLLSCVYTEITWPYATCICMYHGNNKQKRSLSRIYLTVGQCSNFLHAVFGCVLHLKMIRESWH